MTATIIDGRAIATALLREVRAETDALAARGRRPGLAVVMIGDHAASAVYVRNKRRACGEAGIVSFDYDLPPDATESQVLALVDRLNADPAVDGILVQLPLPPQVRADAVIERIDPAKDVDGFHPANIGRLVQGAPRLRPCTPYGVMLMLERSGIPVEGRHAVIVGRSSIVGRPMALELLMRSATVTVCHSRTRDLPAQVGAGEILVAAIGKPEFVRGEWIRPGAVVVDVGINRVADGRLVGDVEFGAARARASAITPVPGGVGPMTVATLMRNTLEAAARRRER
jgi:methylenetetrahydrofolate dehydrogenase (NADP+)/methenyltetrahydrofolate cyclohydrolase